MVIRYPNGQTRTDQQLNKHKIMEESKKSNFANRGMRFEEAINVSNEYYLNRNIAVVHKKPTPVQIVAVDYPRRSAAVIREAYFKEASTTDYNGVYKGLYLDFEAKETKNKTSFPLKNFHQHQITHMKNCIKQDGICFVLLWFSSLQRCFFFPSHLLISIWETNQRQSIPLTTIAQEGIELTLGIAPRIPYIQAIDLYIQTKENHYGK